MGFYKTNQYSKSNYKPISYSNLNNEPGFKFVKPRIQLNEQN